MLFGQLQQTQHHAQALRTAGLMHSLGPGARARTEPAATIQKILFAAFDDVALAAVEMGRIRGELARFGPGVQRDWFAPLVVDAQEPGLLPHPHLTSDVFGRHRVVSPLELHILSIPMHRAPRLKSGPQCLDHGTQKLLPSH